MATQNFSRLGNNNTKWATITFVGNKVRSKTKLFTTAFKTIHKIDRHICSKQTLSAKRDPCKNSDVHSSSCVVKLC
jgi:hypothetical protein